MNEARIKILFPKASRSFLDANRDPSGAEPEHGLGHGPLAAPQAQKKDTGKRAVRITSYRVRLLDPDNLVGKWHLDSLRYAGILSGDTAEDITYQISQKKVQKKVQEKTLIEIS